MTEWYREDLAYIHDVGHADFALRSAPGILEILVRNGIEDGLVVDLGCGSGLWARELMDAGYGVLGIDISQAMIEMARKRAPAAKFRVESLFESEISACEAVTAMGEVLNYLFGPESERRGMSDLFHRVHEALAPGGVFVFDVLGPGQAPSGSATRNFREGNDWVVLVEKEEEAEWRTLTRRIVSFRKVGELYKRDDEIHRARLYEPAEIAAELRRADFEVETLRSYGRYELAENHAAFVARKTSERPANKV